MDSVKQALIWCGIGAATSPIWGTVVWVIWEGSIRPRLIPDGEIESLAAAMLRLYGEKAAEVALALFAPLPARKAAPRAEAD